MKKEMTFSKTQLPIIHMLVVPVMEIYSKIIGVKFSIVDTLHILQVQISLFLLLIPVDAPIIYSIAIFLWFVVSLYQCKYMNEKFNINDD